MLDTALVAWSPYKGSGALLLSLGTGYPGRSIDFAAVASLFVTKPRKIYPIFPKRKTVHQSENSLVSSSLSV